MGDMAHEKTVMKAGKPKKIIVAGQHWKKVLVFSETEITYEMARHIESVGFRNPHSSVVVRHCDWKEQAIRERFPQFQLTPIGKTLNDEFLIVEDW